MGDSIKLPPGATLVSSASTDALPPGATRVDTNDDARMQKRLHDLYDSRPLWRKVLGLEPADSEMNDQDRAYLATQKQKAQAQVADQLHGVYSGYKEGVKEGVKTAPFVVLPELAGTAAAGAAGGGTLGTVANAAAQGATTYAISKAEGAGDKEAAAAGALGAAGPIAEKAIPPVARALRKSAVDQYSKVLAPTTKETKAITAQVVPELIDRGTTAMTRKGLTDTVEKNIGESGQAVNDTIDRIVEQGSKPRPGQKALPPAKAEIPIGEQKVVGEAGTAVIPAEGVTREVQPATRTVVPGHAEQMPTAGVAKELAARNARKQIGSQASTVPDSVLGPTNRNVEELGSTAGTIPERVYSGGKTYVPAEVTETPAVTQTQYGSGGAHPEMSGSLTNPGVLSTADPKAQAATLSALEKIKSNPEHFNSFSANERVAIDKQIEHLRSLVPNASAVTNGPIMSTKPIIDHLEGLKNNFMVDGKVVNQQAIENLSKVQEVISNVGDQVSLQSMRRLRQILDEEVAQGKGFFGKTLAEGSLLNVKKEAADAIRAEFGKTYPDVQKVNAEFSFWKNVGKVLQETERRRVGQEGGLWRTVGPIAAAAGGMAHGGMSAAGGMEAGMGAAGMFALNQAVKSTAWRTTSPILKTQIAEAIAKGNFRQATGMLSKIGAASVSNASSGSKKQEGPEENK